MKKMLILVAVASLVAVSSFANESVLIDFTQLAADTRVAEGDGPNDQNGATVMDFSNVRFAGSFTDEQRGFMRTSLAIENWEVELASSARTLFNNSRSFTRESASARFGTVMGVRVHFPLEPFHSSALIRPPFEIPAFEAAEDGSEFPTRFEGGYGVVHNVATIRALSVNVHGMNFPHTLFVVLLDQNGNRRSVPMGNLQFDGWAELRWDNPNYIQEVRNRDLRIKPIYPDARPFVKFAGFEIRRDGAQPGGDFITYFQNVRIIYDLAVLDLDRDIDDEGIWSIIQDRETSRRQWEMERFGQDQILRHLESQRQAQDATFSPNEAE